MKKKILLIEDDEYISSILKIHLENLGYEVLVTGSAEDGLAQLDDFSPGLILLDVILPGMDGFDTCLKIKSDPHTKQIPVIMLTGLSTIGDIDKAFEVGADDYIVKSSAFHQLVEKLNDKLHVYLPIS